MRTRADAPRGSGGQRWYSSGSASARTLRLVGAEALDDPVARLRYRP